MHDQPSKMVVRGGGWAEGESRARGRKAGRSGEIWASGRAAEGFGNGQEASPENHPAPQVCFSLAAH